MDFYHIFNPTSGCLGWGEDVEISSEIQEEPLRIVFESPTLDRQKILAQLSILMKNYVPPRLTHVGQSSLWRMS